MGEIDIAAPLSFQVDGIGAFEARRRSVKRQMQIEAAYRVAVGADPDDAPESQRTVCAIYADLKVLTAKAPPDWVLDDADLPDVYAVYAALRSAEDRFRKALAEQRKTAGEGA
jgi:hypothetical protein